MSVAGPSSEIFDSLPYYDDDLQKYPNLKAKVDQELARELKALNPGNGLHPRVPPAIELFAVREQSLFWVYGMQAYAMGFMKDRPLLKAEMERARSHQPFPSLDTLRYQLPAPTSTPAGDKEWKEALDNARAQLQHQRIRCVSKASHQAQR